MPKTASQVAGPRRHAPQRTCVSCGAVSAKRQLVRIVRTAEGRVQPDPTGKKPGRGAYLCSDPGCWELAVKKGKLERSLKVAPSAEDIEAITAFAAGLHGSEVAR